MVPHPAATRAEPALEHGLHACAFTDGRWFRVLTVVDQFTRECLLLHAEHSMSGAKVAAALDPVVKQARQAAVHYL